MRKFLWLASCPATISPPYVWKAEPHNESTWNLRWSRKTTRSELHLNHSAALWSYRSHSVSELPSLQCVESPVCYKVDHVAHNKQGSRSRDTSQKHKAGHSYSGCHADISFIQRYTLIYEHVRMHQLSVLRVDYMTYLTENLALFHSLARSCLCLSS